MRTLGAIVVVINALLFFLAGLLYHWASEPPDRQKRPLIKWVLGVFMGFLATWIAFLIGWLSEMP